MLSFLRHRWFALFVLSQFCLIASAQTSIGIQPFGVYTSGFDQINMADLGIHIDIPLFQHQARGQDQGAAVHLVYDSGYYFPLGGGSTYVTDLGWRLTAGTTLPGQIVGTSTPAGTGPDASAAIQNSSVKPQVTISWSFVDSTGYSHVFGGSTSSGGSGGDTSLQTTTADGSGYLLAATGIAATVSRRSGFIYTPGKTGDPNGNVGKPSQAIPAPAAGWNATETDTSNVSVTVAGGAYSTPLSFTAFTSPVSRTPIHVGYIDASGNPQTVTVNYTSHYIAWSCSTPPAPAFQYVALIDSVVYPDGSQYSFDYATNGAINSITLPSGGTIKYQGNQGAESSCLGAFPSSVTRTTSDGAVTYQRTVNASSNGVATAITTHVSKPDQSSETILMVGFIDYYETAHSWINSLGATVRSTLRCYNGNTSACSTASLTLPITQIATTTTLDNSQNYKRIQTFNTQGLQTELDEYDFGAANPARKTTTTYASLGNNIVDKPLSVVITDGSNNQIGKTTYGYDEYSLATSSASGLAAVSGSRGNVTSEHDWLNTTGATLDSHWCYDNAGQVVSSQDPAASANGQSCTVGHLTSYGHDSTDTYATSTTPPTPSSGVALTSGATYDTPTGLSLTATDPNGTKVSFAAYDSMLRPTTINTLDSGGNTVGEHTYSYSPTQLSAYNYQSAGVYADTETLYDGYGRVSRVAVANGQSGNPWYQQDSCYDASGRLQFRSYRYQGAGFAQAKVCTGSGDAYVYDSLGRVTKLTHADGTFIMYSYTGRATKVVDENSVTRISQTDGLGRITSVCEVSASNLPGVVACGQDISATGFLTTYSYTTDTSYNQVVTVAQGVQSRVFKTDSVGRTVSVTEPERGTSSYTYAYNSTGLMTTRKRPKANQTSINTLTTTTTQYDTVGRVTLVTYDDGTPAKYYLYDSNLNRAGFTQTNLKGRLSKAYVNNADGTWQASAYSYDAMGRVIENSDCEPSGCGTYDKLLSYSYDWTGNLTSELDPVSGLVGYGRSPAGEATSITQQSYQIYTGNPATLVSTVLNGPNGPVSYTLGNGLNVNRTFDVLDRPNGQWLCSGSLNAGCAGGSQIYADTWGLRGSQIQSVTDTILNQSTSYGYDEFNRLKSRTVNGGTVQNFTYSYDRYGNRLSQTVTAGSGPQPSFSFNEGNNQIVGYSYDAAGNMTSDGTYLYSYDADGNLIQVKQGATVVGTYIYDALNQRIRAQTGTTINEYVYDYAGRRTSSWLLGVSGYPGGFGNEGRIYWDGQQIAYRAWDGTTYFEHQDYLGTERLRTTYTGTVAASFTSLPWGDGLSATIGGTGANQDNAIFAGLDLDTNASGAPFSGHAQFRNYSSIQGRWLSPDPYDGSYDATNPQSFNRYAYALNNPLAFKDPSGLVICDWGSSDLGGEDYDDDEDCQNDGGVVVNVDATVTVNADGSGSDWIELDTEDSLTLIDYGTTGGSSNAPNNGNPCASAGNAPDPSTYAQKGQAASSNAVKDFLNLFNFRRGGALDAQVGPGPNGQPFGGSPSYANYTFGVYMAAAGYTLGQTLAGADIYAQYRSRYPAGTPMAGPNYPFTPQTNVNNITNGFNAQTTGTTCHKPG